MEISKEDIKSLASLCKLSFTDEETEDFSDEFKDFLSLANGVNKDVFGDNRDVKVVQSYVSLDECRQDEEKGSLPQEKILSCTGDKEFFTVRRVVK